MRVDRRAALALGGGVVAVGALAAVGVAVRSPYAPAPELPVGSWDPGPAAGTYDLGGHRVELGGPGGPRPGQFRVLRGTTPVWWARDGVIAAGRGALEWSDAHGHFSDRRRLATLWTEARCEQVAAVGTDTLRLIGRFVRPHRDAGAEPVWTLVLVSRGDTLEVEVSVPAADVVLLRSGLAADEAVHGLGAQFTGFDLRGRDLVLVTREQGVGRGKQPVTVVVEKARGAGGSPTTTYAPMPTLVTAGLRRLDWDQDRVAEADLRGGRLDLSVWDARITARWRTGAGPRELVRTPHDGLPGWTGTGAVVAAQGGSAEVRRKLAALDGAAVCAVWIQDWVGQRTTGFGSRLWWTWELDRRRYPDWEQLVAELGARGIRVLTYINPFVVDPGEKPGGVRRDLYHEALERGFLVGHPDGGPYLLDQDGFMAAMVDLTNPAAYAWYGQVIGAMPRTGGWMADFGESLPFDAVLHDGDPRELHNRWPVLWEQLCASVRGADEFVFHRSAWRGSRAAHWAGDQLTSWDAYDGMASALLGMLAGGVSGLPLMHADAGGYTSLPQPVIRAHRDTELLLRWCEWCVWSPVLRTHEGNRPDENAQVWDAGAAPAFVQQTRVFRELAPYRAGVVADDLPAIRHCWVEVPGTEAARRDDQYFFGPSFLVAPVLEPGVTGREVALPPGRWVLVWTGEEYAGDRVVRVRSLIGQPPVFHRAEDATAADLSRRIRAL
ncbi:TIM-barrel domain-containing protein [Raineyella sp.]|uniref:TIM-barrel domain-containing protein n=1 Tax=Raineyella sp. TaxID=1911550 RepID=UPI002B20B65C|nr:TIM-barrel domain-containing protein [Raineyella sp.]MEA5154309.1 glycoside hydrolase family 31 protein [Raineyella sp.]